MSVRLCFRFWAALGLIVDGPSSTDSVEKLLFRSYSKNSRAAEASLLLGCGGPCNLLLRATRTVLTSAATIRRVNCREQRTLTRIRSMCILEFFNGIGREPRFTMCALSGRWANRARAGNGGLQAKSRIHTIGHNRT